MKNYFNQLIIKGGVVLVLGNSHNGLPRYEIGKVSILLDIKQR